MTQDEMEKRNIEEMGETLGKQYSVLFHEFAALNLYWKEFLELFGTNDKRIDRLNRSAPGFFRMLQEQQFETNMLHMARLTDSPKSVGKANLTIRNLPDLVSDPGLKQQLIDLVDVVRQKTEFCRAWRNRRFAHHDLLIATEDGKATPLNRPEKEKVSEAFEAISDVLNAIERFYFRGACSFDVIPALNGAATLLFVLGFGVKGREEMEAKIASKQFDDLGAPEII
jgi:hypothetical protein